MPSKRANRDELLVAAVSGDTAALEQLIDQLRPQLLATAWAMLRDHLVDDVDPGDAVQQGLASAYARFTNFRGRTAEEFEVWLTTTVRRAALDLIRSRHTTAQDVRREVNHTHDDVVANLPDESSAPRAMLDLVPLGSTVEALTDLS